MVKKLVKNPEAVMMNGIWLVRDANMKVSAIGVTLRQALRNFVLSVRYYVKVGEIK